MAGTRSCGCNQLPVNAMHIVLGVADQSKLNIDEVALQRPNEMRYMEFFADDGIEIGLT